MIDLRWLTSRGAHRPCCHDAGHRCQQTSKVHRPHKTEDLTGNGQRDTARGPIQKLGANPASGFP